MKQAKNPPSLWQGQMFHLISLLILIPLVGYLWVAIGKPFPVVFWVSIAIPIAHQTFVWLSLRCELLYSGTSKSIGFRLYLVVFLFFLQAGLCQFPPVQTSGLSIDEIAEKIIHFF